MGEVVIRERAKKEQCQRGLYLSGSRSSNTRILKVPLNIKIIKCLFWNDSLVEWIWIPLFATE